MGFLRLRGDLGLTECLLCGHEGFPWDHDLTLALGLSRRSLSLILAELSYGYDLSRV